MNKELQKRVFTSICLLSLIILMFFYTYILIVALMIISIISWIEFNALISKILKQNDTKNNLLRFLYKSISLIYLSFLNYLILITKLQNPEFEIFIIYSILVSISSDMGGLIVGKIIKGKKLTKISPNKTISGSIGAFIFSLFLVPFLIIYSNSFDLITIVMTTLLISLVSQLGDLFVSFLKRKAKVKDTSDLLPGHGGILDRIDGIIFAIPFGFFILNSL